MIDAVGPGGSAEDRIDASVRRILIMKSNRGVVADPLVDAAAVGRVVGTPEHLAAAAGDHRPHHHPGRRRRRPGAAAGAGKKVLVTGWGATTQILADGLAAKGAAGRPSAGPAPRRPTRRSRPPWRRRRARTRRGHDDEGLGHRGHRQAPRQQKLVSALRATGKPVLVVALRDPYDIAYLGDIESYLVTYSYSPVAVESALRVITGENNARGQAARRHPDRATPTPSCTPSAPASTSERDLTRRPRMPSRTAASSSPAGPLGPPPPASVRRPARDGTASPMPAAAG